jgi:hypothetical protein
LGFKDFNGLYQRHGLARRIVNAPADATWRAEPTVSDDGKDPEAEQDTAFEEAFGSVAQRLRLFHYLHRADRLSGIGHYGVILIGLKGQSELDQPAQPVSGPEDVIFLAPFSEANAEIDKWVDDPGSPRYGQPEFYKLNLVNGAGNSASKRVHFSRIIHIAEDLGEDEVYGTPRLKSIYNRIMDLDKLTGGAAEMFWRGAFPGYNFAADKDTSWDPATQEQMQEQVDEFVHGLRRYLKTKGVDVQSLTPQVASPREHFDVLIAEIAGSKGIPQRILTGSERGELASGQDENNWNDRVDERRQSWAGPSVLRQVVDRLLSLEALPAPVGDYAIEWPEIDALDAQTKATIAKTLSEAIATYVNAQGADMVVPIRPYLEDVLKLPEPVVERVMEEVNDMLGRDVLPEGDQTSDLPATAPGEEAA